MPNSARWGSAFWMTAFVIWLSPKLHTRQFVPEFRAEVRPSNWSESAPGRGSVVRHQEGDWPWESTSSSMNMETLLSEEGKMNHPRRGVWGTSLLLRGLRVAEFRCNTCLQHLGKGWTPSLLPQPASARTTETVLRGWPHAHEHLQFLLLHQLHAGHPPLPWRWHPFTWRSSSSSFHWR